MAANRKPWVLKAAVVGWLWRSEATPRRRVRAELDGVAAVVLLGIPALNHRLGGRPWYPVLPVLVLSHLHGRVA